MKSKIFPVATFNKENALVFAEDLYSEKDKEITYTRLCNGYVEEDGPKKLHCAIGEAYFRFVSHNMRWVRKMDNNETTSYKGKYEEGSTGRAVDSLIKKAILKDPSEVGQAKFASALLSCVSTNDNVPSVIAVDGPPSASDIDNEYHRRAEQVAKTWRKEVVPLLK